MFRRANKYRAKKIETPDGIFHSKGEYERYKELLLLLKAGEISGLSRQHTFPLQIDGELICKFIADFIYEEKKEFVAEDFKGFLTRDTRIKHKLFRALYPSWKLKVTKSR